MKTSYRRTSLGAMVLVLLAPVRALSADALFIDSTGNVGVGTSTPSNSLHVARSDGTAQILVEESSGTYEGRNLFKIANNGPTRFQFENTGAGEKWTFNSAAGELRIAHSGTGETAGTEFKVFANGNATLSGLLTQNSDVNAKQNIKAVNHETVLSKVMALPIAEWSYKDAPESRHMGPMAQDFYKSFELGDTDTGISSIDTGGVALSAIQAVKKEKDSEIEQLKAELHAQNDRIIQLEMALVEVLRQQSSEAEVASAN